jgi:hypothetical protein
MQQTPDKQIEDRICLGLGANISKVIFAINLCRMHNTTSRRLANLVVGNGKVLF